MPHHPLLGQRLCKILLGEALLSSKEQTGWKFLIYLSIASNLTCRLVPEYWNLGVHCSNIILGKRRKGVKTLFLTFANVMHYLYNIYHFYFLQSRILWGERNRPLKLSCIPTGFKLQPFLSEGCLLYGHHSSGADCLINNLNSISWINPEIGLLIATEVFLVIPGLPAICDAVAPRILQSHMCVQLEYSPHPLMWFHYLIRSLHNNGPTHLINPPCCHVVYFL